MVYMSLHSEYTRSYPGKVVDLIKHFSIKEMLRLDSSPRNSIHDEAHNGLIKSPAKTSVDLKVKNEKAKDDDKKEIKDKKNVKPIKADVSAKKVDQANSKNVKDHKETNKTNTKARGKAGDEGKMKK